MSLKLVVAGLPANWQRLPVVPVESEPPLCDVNNCWRYKGKRFGFVPSGVSGS